MMSPELTGLLGFGVLMLLMYLGMPIGFCMALTGFLGNALLFSWSGALIQLGMVPYATIGTFTLCIIPLFSLMGNIAFASGLSSSAYYFMYRVLGRLRGGLAMATVAACALFAACTGSSVATAVTMTQVALPEMKKYHYKEALSTGSICAGGSLGMLIPPSAPLIIYSILTGASIGRLWLAGIVPGMMLLGFFVLAIAVQTKINPELGPAGERASFITVLKEGIRLWKVVLLVVAVLGGLWGGVFSPSQAGAVGSLIALFILIGAKRKDAVKDLASALMSTCKSAGMIFSIVIGAMIFGDFMTASKLPEQLVTLITRYDLKPLTVVFILMCVYVVLGAFTDELAVMLLTVPILMPVLKHLGIDPVWFGILFIINQQMGMILPPVGMLVFVLSGMLPDVPMYTIYRGIVPFAIVMFIAIIIVMLIPQVATWLPGLLMGSG
jgi:C4-dicarboxylate transporter, DctM subunit